MKLVAMMRSRARFSGSRLASRSPGDLFDDELIVGQILIERIDDVIPVKVRLGNGSVGVAREVEPMPAPTLAVVLRSEEFIGDFFECAE
jgi:hypothetical protein